VFKQIKNKVMKTMELLTELIGEQTYMVVDNPSNRFNFCDLVEVTPELVQEFKNVAVWDLTKDLPDDVQRAIEVMAENDVELEDFTGIIRFERDDDTYYVLFIKQ
jgi:hypothetical protein